jgi:hypothetical protein
MHLYNNVFKYILKTFEQVWNEFNEYRAHNLNISSVTSVFTA